MNKRTIYITDFDLKRLTELIKDPSKLAYSESECLESLKDELAQAQVVDSKDIPANVITMNSVIQYIDMDTKEEDTLTLVFPSDSDVSEGKISVLAPIGTAMLGYKAGDIIKWEVPEGERRLKIKKVLYQPEASGDYHL